MGEGARRGAVQQVGKLSAACLLLRIAMNIACVHAYLRTHAMLCVAGLERPFLRSRLVNGGAVRDAQFGNEKIIVYFSTALSFFS